jgi:hypothetical protein
MQKKFKRPVLDTRTSVILWANWFQFAPGERALNSHVLSRMLLWCHEGKGRARVNGTWYLMNPDEFIFLPWQHEVLYAAVPGGWHSSHSRSSSQPKADLFHLP